jgi:Cu-Zn family superoxide dismutase
MVLVRLQTSGGIKNAKVHSVGALACRAMLTAVRRRAVGQGGDRPRLSWRRPRATRSAARSPFVQSGDKLTVFAEVSGLTPGLHGFHIHEKGDCSAPDGTSAGGHFNPTGKPHGSPEHAQHHAGDLMQLVADANGNARQVSYVRGRRSATGRAASSGAA